MENNSPYSAIARAKEIRISKTPKPDGKLREIKLPAPSPHEVSILRRIARGALLVTMIDGTPVYCYEDGTAVGSGDRSANPFKTLQFKRFVSQGWIVPDKTATGLLEDTPQRYVVPPLR